jgi:hypothetical protein
MGEKEYKYLKDLLISFRLYFVIAEDVRYLYHVLYVSMNIYGIECQKKLSGVIRLPCVAI